MSLTRERHRHEAAAKATDLTDDMTPNDLCAGEARKAGARDRAGARETEILVDDDDAFIRPAGPRPLSDPRPVLDCALKCHACSAEAVTGIQ